MPVWSPQVPLESTLAWINHLPQAILTASFPPRSRAQLIYQIRQPCGRLARPMKMVLDLVSR